MPAKLLTGLSIPQGPDRHAFGVKLPKAGPTGYTRADKKRGAGIKSGITRPGRSKTALPRPVRTPGPAGPLGSGGGNFRSPSVQLPARQRFGGTGGGFLGRFFRQFGKG